MNVGHIGRFRIIEALGSSAEAETFLASGDALERLVVVKRWRQASDPHSHHRLGHHLRQLARITHPNVAEVFDLLEEDRRNVLVREHVGGVSFRDVLASTSVGDPRRLAILEQAAQGLAAHHEVGLLHRRVKPENILVSADDTVRVTDADAAAPTIDGDGQVWTTPLTLPSSIATGATELAVGDGPFAGPFYMSPEQLGGLPLDRRSDVFALTVMLYEAVTGGLPFIGQTAVALAHALRSGEPRPLPAGVPEPIARLIEHGLRPDPADRPITMSEVAARLRSR